MLSGWCSDELWELFLRVVSRQNSYARRLVASASQMLHL